MTLQYCISGQCCRVAIICGLLQKFQKIYFFVFHHYPLATLANPGRGEGHALLCCSGCTIASNGGQGTTQIDKSVQCGVESGIIPKHWGAESVVLTSLSRQLQGVIPQNQVSTSWVHLHHHRIVTYNFDFSGCQNYGECAVQCSGCMSNRQSTVGVCRANIGDQSRACGMRSCLFLYPCSGVYICTDIHTEYSTKCIVLASLTKISELYILYKYIHIHIYYM